MAQNGYTPILIYASGTATNVPLAANMTSTSSGAELAINYADGKLYYKNSSGVVTLLVGTGGAGVVAGSNTQVQFNNSGVFGASANLTWDGTSFSATNYVATGSITSSSSKGVYSYGTLSYSDVNHILTMQSSQNSYIQMEVQNTNTGTAASSDVVVGNNNTTASTYYGDFGMNSSGWTGTPGTNSFGAPNMVYLTATTGDLLLGTTTANPIRFATNGGADAMYIDTSGNVGIGTTNPSGFGSLLAVRNDSGTCLSLNSTGSAKLNFQNIGTDSFSIAMPTGTGALAFYSSGTTERMRIDSSGNVGIGTSSPSSFGKLVIVSTGTPTTAYASVLSGAGVYNAGFESTFYIGASRTDILNSGSIAGYRLKTLSPDSGGAYLAFEAASSTPNSSAPPTTFTERMRINSSGNVGIGGTPNPSWSTTGAIKCISMFSNGSAIPSALYSSGGNSNGSGLVNNGYNNGSGWYYDYSSSFGSSRYELNGGSHYWYIAGTGTGGNPISYTQAMTLDSSGNLLVGQTSNAGQNSNSFALSVSNGNIYTNHVSGTSSGNGFITFNYNGAIIGSITQNGTTGVLFNTTSDYRLKNDVSPLQNALSTVEALNPVSFTWIDGRKDDGFLAHEIQAIIPNCVTGEKDAINEDGTPKYQQMDNSGVIPFLVKAIQEQQALITSLTTRLTALENK
jgi:hypothetical protein